jgi:hypothetical protein
MSNAIHPEIFDLKTEKRLAFFENYGMIEMYRQVR